MSKLRSVLSGGVERIHEVELALMGAKDEGVSILHEPTQSGAPLLVEWYRRQQAQPDRTFRRHGESRESFHVLFWRLVDSGFDVKTHWSWNERHVNPSTDPDGPSQGQVDLLDLMLDSADVDLLKKLEDRWGEPWSPSFLSRRTRCLHNEKLHPGTAAVLPGLHFDVTRRNQKMVKWWLSKGVDINLRDSSGQTALFHASSSEIARLLLTKGADARALDVFGRNAFEHWVDLSYFTRNSQYSRQILESLPKARPHIPADVLARAVEQEISFGNQLKPWVRTALVALRPHLSESFIFGPDPHQKIDGEQVLASFKGTLLAVATRDAWTSSSPKSFEILVWLVANTPGKANTFASKMAKLALLAFRPAEAQQVPTGGPLPVVSFPDALLDINEQLIDPYQVCSQAKFRVAEMLLGVAAAVLEQQTKQSPSPAWSKYGRLISPSPEQWLDSDQPGGSILSQVLACAADIAEGHEVSIGSDELPQALMSYVHAGLPVPQDTLLPALRIMNMFAPGKLEASVLGISEKPGPVDMEGAGLPLALAWWVTAGAQESKDAFEAAAAPESLRKSLETRLKNSPAPWPAWMAIWEARRLERSLSSVEEGPATALRPRARM